MLKKYNALNNFALNYANFYCFNKNVRGWKIIAFVTHRIFFSSFQEKYRLRIYIFLM